MKGSQLKFFLLTYAITWTCFFSGIPALFLLGTIAPSIVALILTAWTEGRDAVQALVGRIFRFEVPAKWYVFAIAYTPVIKLTAALIHRMSLWL